MCGVALEEDWLVHMSRFLSGGDLHNNAFTCILLFSFIVVHALHAVPGL